MPSSHWNAPEASAVAVHSLLLVNRKTVTSDPAGAVPLTVRVSAAVGAAGLICSPLGAATTPCPTLTVVGVSDSEADVVSVPA